MLGASVVNLSGGRGGEIKSRGESKKGERLIRSSSTSGLASEEPPKGVEAPAQGPEDGKRVKGAFGARFRRLRLAVSPASERRCLCQIFAHFSDPVSRLIVLLHDQCRTHFLIFADGEGVAFVADLVDDDEGFVPAGGGIGTEPVGIGLEDRSRFSQ